MNEIMKSIYARKSMRAFEEKEVPENIKEELINAALQAPTAGNQVLYSILEISDEGLKEKLAVTCDNQPFIAKAPLVLVFLADCRRWLDTYRFANIKAREPLAGDMLLAIEDAMIAAQNTVVAAESFGLGSCYIGDILENYEQHVELLNLDKYTIPISMVLYGYPTKVQKDRQKPTRVDKKYVVFKNQYRRLSGGEHRDMIEGAHPSIDFDSFVKAFCERKYMSGFSKEMSRSAEMYIKNFMGL
ncbi:MAG: nitroreductase family protein [Clostridiales bacterium]|jgi:nitroreductase|nr:nitroreductase family protein [Clostridiales bacterium]